MLYDLLLHGAADAKGVDVSTYIHNKSWFSILTSHQIRMPQSCSARGRVTLLNAAQNALKDAGDKLSDAVKDAGDHLADAVGGDVSRAKAAAASNQAQGSVSISTCTRYSCVHLQCPQRSCACPFFALCTVHRAPCAMSGCTWTQPWSSLAAGCCSPDVGQAIKWAPHAT